MRKSSLALLLVCLSTSAFSAGEFYCCHDASSGRRVCGDILPAQCRGSAYSVFDRSGNRLRDVGPPLTPEQKAAQAQEEQRRKQQEEAAREQRRLDQALLDTYASRQDIDVAEKQAEDDVNFAIKATQDKIDMALKKRQKLEQEAEFYKKKTLPQGLERDLRAIDHEIKVQRELIDFKKRELDTVRAKYDADRKRYLELTGRSSSAPARPR